MFHPRLKGDYHAMGYRYGSLLARNGFKIPPQSKEYLEFGRRSEPLVEKVFPEVLDEMKGFAEGCHSPFEQFRGFMLSIGALRMQPACSVLAVRGSGGTLLARNYDFFYSFKDYCESTIVRPEGAFCSVGNSDVFIGRDDGMNEKGLAVAITGVEGKHTQPGVSFVLATRGVLDKCSSTDEGIAFLRTCRPSSAYTFTLADRSGEMAVVEWSPRRSVVRQPPSDTDYIVATNHFNGPGMMSMEKLEERQKSNWDSVPRYQAITGALKQGRKSINAVKEILRDHEGSVCSHQEEKKLGTIWSAVFDLKRLQMHLCEGHPCDTEYKIDMRLANAVKRQQPR